MNDAISSGFGVVVETLLSKDRKLRYQQPRDLIHDLKNLIAGQPPDIAQQSVSDYGNLREGESLDGMDQMVELQIELESRETRIRQLVQWNSALAILSGLLALVTIAAILI